jgi:hypothetical protein
MNTAAKAAPKADEEKNKLKAQINGVYQEIIQATNGVPKAIAGAKFEKAKRWKETAVAWRKIALKGCGNFGVVKLESLLAAAKSALTELKAS